MESWMMGILYGDGRKTRRFVLGQGQASSLYMHYGLALHMGLDVEKLVYTYYLRYLKHRAIWQMLLPMDNPYVQTNTCLGKLSWACGAEPPSMCCCAARANTSQRGGAADRACQGSSRAVQSGGSSRAASGTVERATPEGLATAMQEKSDGVQGEHGIDGGRRMVDGRPTASGQGGMLGSRYRVTDGVFLTKPPSPPPQSESPGGPPWTCVMGYRLRWLLEVLMPSRCCYSVAKGTFGMPPHKLEEVPGTLSHGGGQTHMCVHMCRGGGE